jgi:hypothetical protein
MLTLEAGALTVTSGREEHSLPIPVNRIGRARRRRGTPILEVVYTDARAEESRIFLYFTKPPPLPGPGTSPSRARWRGGPRGLHRTASALSLQAANRVVKRRIQEWEAAIKRAVSEGRPG